MSGEASRRHNGWHYADGIEPEILADMRAGRAVLVFDLSNEGPAYDPAFHKRDDGSYLIAGWMPAVDFAALLHIDLPLQQRPYQTFAGFLLQEFGRIPEEGDHVVAYGWRFEVMDLDSASHLLNQPGQPVSLR
eukprot:gene3413-4651_t